jgi:hypothetical protein
VNRWDGFALGGLALGLLGSLALMGGPMGFSAGMDFNGASLEDWMGPFYQQALSVMGGEAQPVEGFIYPPSAAVMLAPLAWLGPALLAWVGLGLQLLSLAVLVLLVARLGRPSESWLDLLFLGLATGSCYPLLHSLHWGQMGAPLAALCALSLLLWQKERPGPAAWVLAVATGIKFYPAILWLPRFFVAGVRRVDWIAALVVLVGLPLAVLGSDAFAFGQQVLDRLDIAVGAGGDWAGSVNRQGFAQVLGRLLGLPEAGLLERAISLALLAAALWHGRTLALKEGWVMGAGLLLACLPFFPGPCWPHHLGALPICWWLAAQRGMSSRVLVGFSVFLGSLPAFVLYGGWPDALSMGLPAWSGVAVGLAFVLPSDS